MNDREKPWKCWTIYDRPTDFPDRAVGRQYILGEGKVTPTDNIIVGATVEYVRQTILSRHPGLIRFNRDPTDDKYIVETWM